MFLSKYNVTRELQAHDIYRQPIWFNDKIKIDDNTIFYESWFSVGIVFINDLLDDNGHFYTYHGFIQVYGIKVDFLKYYGVINCLKQNWPNFFNKGWKLPNPLSPSNIDVLIQNKQGCKCFADIFVKDMRSDVSLARVNWERDLKITLSNSSWESICSLPFLTTTDSKLRWLQFRVIHRILNTNSFLNKIGHLDSDLCQFCNLEPETISHKLYLCSFTQTFWNEVFSWFRSTVNYNRSHTLHLIIFGTNTDKILNLILLLGKLYIYNTKMNNSRLLLRNFKSFVNIYYRATLYTANLCDNTAKKFNLSWNYWKGILE